MPLNSTAAEPQRAGQAPAWRVALLQDRDAALAPVVLNEATHEIPKQYLDCTKAKTRMGWKPRFSFEDGLRDTVAWYRQNEWWWRPIKEQDPAFQSYYRAQYGDRRG